MHRQAHRQRPKSVAVPRRTMMMMNPLNLLRRSLGRRPLRLRMTMKSRPNPQRSPGRRPSKSRTTTTTRSRPNPQRSQERRPSKPRTTMATKSRPNQQRSPGRRSSKTKTTKTRLLLPFRREQRSLRPSLLHPQTTTMTMTSRSFLGRELLRSLRRRPTAMLTAMLRMPRSLPSAVVRRNLMRLFLKTTAT